MKKLLPIALALMMLLALATPVMAAPGNGKATGTVNEFNFDVNNANFHCNDIEGENGRVWPNLSAFGVVDGKGNGGGNNKNKTASTFNVTRVSEGSTTWSLNEEIVCSCGRTDWVTFSNNSGTPNGNNVQLQHTAPSRRWITIQVVYHLSVPECQIQCVNAGAACGFVEHELSQCPSACSYEVTHPGHPCGFVCHTGGHDCPFVGVDLTCGTVCECAASLTQTIVEQKELIIIADGYLFAHEAPDAWEGGAYASGPKSISETLYQSKTYDVYYVGAGDCVCVCDPIVCDVECEPCLQFSGIEHVHIAVCDNCKGGQGGNHKNHVDGNPESNTNYVCVECPDNNGEDYKLGQYNTEQGWKNMADDVIPPLVCACPICN